MKRFKYHFEPSKGWMNDPNGLCQYNGNYHFFYQYYPYDTKWGPMHWGHTITKDFIHYEELPIALTPSEEYENDGGCFSGSAIEKDGILYLIYTSVSKKYGQMQSVAFSKDGINFTKYEGNPVIKELPRDASRDFRDPKIIKYNDEYLMILGTKVEGHGRIISYSSSDLLNWKYKGIVFDCIDYLDAVECPDLFKLNDKWILMYSKIGNPIKACEFLIGEFDGTKFKKEKSQIVEYGPHFYAPQTFEDIKGRRIIVGWYYSWDRKLDEGAYSAGAFAAPREILLENDTLKIYPCEELYPYIKEVTSFSIEGIDIKLEQNKLIVSNGIKEVILEGPIDSLEALEDEKGVELFINKGEKSISILK